VPPCCQVFELPRSPVTDDGPLGQLAQGHERDAGRGAYEASRDVGREAVTEGSGGHIRIKDNEAHAIPARRDS